MDVRRFIVNLLSNCMSAVTGVGLTFFLTPYLVDTLGKEAYGFYPLSNNFIMYAGILTTALNSMASRFITISLEKKEIQQVNIYFNSVLFGNLFVSLFFIITGGLFCYFAQYILAIPTPIAFDVKLLFVFVFLGLVINVSSSIFSVSAFALNRFDRLALINIVMNLIRLLIIVLLFYFFVPRIYFLGVASLFSSLYYMFANYRLTKKIMPEIVFSFKNFSWVAIYTLIGAGVWNSVLALSNVINTQLDLILANRFFGASDMGILSLTKMVPIALQMLLGIIVPLFLPELLKAYANNDLKKMKANLDFSFKAIFIVLLLPIAIFFVFGQEFFRLWLPHENSQQLYLLSIITLVPFIIHGTIETIHHVFVITNKLRLASFWGIFISVLSVITVVLLCRFSTLGLYAIPIGALLTGMFSHLTFTPIYAACCLDEKKTYFYKRIAKGIGSFLMLMLIAFLWKYLSLIPVESWLGFILSLSTLTVILLIVCAFVLFDKSILGKMYVEMKGKLKL
ncbi:lipopolysaccharide biosynthesis protein [Sphingobacterium sp. Ag1]|uniref:lipopolysaccharide biosynthesis protein n=1 Tax=Sphingobacterium sp. Ag1 TaxID=1643451 RepID=UPI000A07D50D|nr:lipopolysaccharide biosynthesis protein [Sphingobacterium sp. Ag1]